VAAPARLGRGAEVVDVQVATPGQAVGDAKAGHGRRLGTMGLERAHQPVALGPLHLVDRSHERLGALERRAQGRQGGIRRGRLALHDLPDHAGGG
jgi:hypothetical protein